MNIIFYDIILLAAFVVFVIIFLTIKRENLKRQGILYLYKTHFGINFIDRFVKKFNKLLKPLQYIVIVCGYVLMGAIIWLMVKTTYLYLTTSISKVFRAPPIAPLIPYFPKLFGLEDYFPPLYFTYFILALAVVAISHEFAHGIFARLNNFRILSTGFAFLGPVLGAFVEPDEKQMAKGKKFSQLVVLAAGTFANVIMFLVFGGILMLFFSAFFVPAGVKFNSYAITSVEVSDIVVIGNSTIAEGLIEIAVNDTHYFVNDAVLNQSLEKKLKSIVVYDNSPAFRAQLKGAITEINGKKLRSLQELQNTLKSFNPGENITLKTAILIPGQEVVQELRTYNLQLSEREGKTFLGIGFMSTKGSGVIGFLYDKTLAKVKEPLILYDSTIGNFGWFVYYLFWWIVVINILVALFNMLPLGILDGGRFFYLTIWGITKKEKIGKIAYKFMSWFLLAILALMMVKWLFSFVN